MLRGLIALAAVAAAVLVFAAAPSAALRGGGEVTLVYVGADDCAPCRNWQNREAVAFRASPLFTRVTYREVKAPALFDLLKDEYWPEDLRSYRAQLGRGAAAPLWLVIADGEIVTRGAGPSQWQAAIVPAIEMLRP